MKHISNIPYQPRAEQPQPKRAVDSGAAKMVNALFETLKAIFPAWRQAFPDNNTEMLAKREWVKGFVDNDICEAWQVDLGIKNARNSKQQWFPSIGQFIEWCKPTPENLGLPSTAQALKEASTKLRFGDQDWSHPAVYVAAKATGAWELKTMSYNELLPLFERNYQVAIDRVIRGEDLSSEIPKALPERVYVIASNETALKHISAMKARFAKAGDV